MRSVRGYIIRRLLLAPLTLLGVTLLVFCLTRLVPGGPVDRILQERAISALSGEKSTGIATDSVSEREREKLEDLFNLNEPLWKAYLQWLGIRRSRVETYRAEFNGNGIATITAAAADGSPRLLEVRLRADGSPLFITPPWFRKEAWNLRIETGAERAERLRKTRGRSAPAPPGGNPPPPRAILYREAYNGLLQGNLGRSYKYNEPVMGMILQRLPVSLYFGILGALVAYMLSIPLGIFKALHHGSVLDGATSLLIFIGYAVPGFALGAILLIYLGARLEYFPLYGLTGTDFETLSAWEKVTDIAEHTALPLTCYVVGALAMTTMMMKNSMLENLSADYMRTAVAKGLSYRRAVWRHAVRNSLIPIASGLGGVICSVVGGSILIERVFDIRGFGMLSYQALMDKDYSLIMGTLLVSSIVIVIGNLLSDILVACLDPRITFR